MWAEPSRRRWPAWGITAVVVEGVAAAGQCLVLEIDEGGNARLLDAPDCQGMRTYALVEKLKAAHGENNSITCIGPAGEFLLSAASIQTTDLDGRPCPGSGPRRAGCGHGIQGAEGDHRQPGRQICRFTGRSRDLQGCGKGLCQSRQGR